ncbi:MAG: hypothetical protein GXY67_00425 [Clostridiales bacterium]|nr:hypothetical protein [Clostridiales bacterium]
MILILAAAIGIGSNSLRMLVAEMDPADAQLQRVMRDRVGLRVFAALDENNVISSEMICEAEKCVGAFVDKARAYSVDQIHLFATSAVRDAQNQKEFCDRIEKAVGIRPEVCTGTLEAKLSFLGATDDQPSGMIDIGGGSTEIVMGQGERIDFSTSLQIGAVRLYQEMPIANVAQAYHVVDYVRCLLNDRFHFSDGLTRSLAWVGVGGTFTTLSALIQNIPWSSKEHIHGFFIMKEALCHYMERLAPMDITSRLMLPGLSPHRADIVVHGLAILLGCMETLGIQCIRASEFGNLEGYLKARYLRK